MNYDPNKMERSFSRVIICSDSLRADSYTVSLDFSDMNTILKTGMFFSYCEKKNNKMTGVHCKSFKNYFMSKEGVVIC